MENNAKVNVEETQTEAQLLEISPIVFRLLEEMRTLVNENSLTFYRKLLRKGAIATFGSDKGTYGLIGAANKEFLDDSTLANNEAELEAARRIKNRRISDLNKLKAQIEKL
jgi:hypothetical protein